MYKLIEEYQYLFIALASILNTRGADLEMKNEYVVADEIFNNECVIKYTNIPHIGSGNYNGDQGFYFRANGDYFGISLEKIRDGFPINIDGYKFECVGVSEFEIEPGERTWSESVEFIVTKNGENIYWGLNR